MRAEPARPPRRRRVGKAVAVAELRRTRLDGADLARDGGEASEATAPVAAIVVAGERDGGDVAGARRDRVVLQHAPDMVAVARFGDGEAVAVAVLQARPEDVAAAVALGERLFVAVADLAHEGDRVGGGGLRDGDRVAVALVADALDEVAEAGAAAGLDDGDVVFGRAGVRVICTISPT